MSRIVAWLLFGLGLGAAVAAIWHAGTRWSWVATAALLWLVAFVIAPSKGQGP